MVMGAPLITAPAIAAAAVGMYVYDRVHSNTKAFGGGSLASIRDLVAKVREASEVKSSLLPKLAPQFDGLHCFETFVA